MQKQIDESVSARPEVEQRMIDQQTGFDIGYEKIFENAGIDSNIIIVPDVTQIKQAFGRDIGGYFNPKRVSKKAGKDVNPRVNIFTCFFTNSFRVKITADISTERLFYLSYIRHYDYIRIYACVFKYFFIPYIKTCLLVYHSLFYFGSS